MDRSEPKVLGKTISQVASEIETHPQGERHTRTEVEVEGQEREARADKQINITKNRQNKSAIID